MAVNLGSLVKNLSLWSAGGDGRLRGFDKLGSTPADVRAFPNAMGMAALTRGAAGYSGTKSIAFVDNLNDTGAGSLREAVEGFGKEGTFVIFRTSGIINLATTLFISSPFVTLAFQTSPSGICIAGANLNIYQTTDIIMRHARSRLGSHSTVDETDAEALSIWNSDNVMIDQSSFSWGKDETVAVTSYGGTPFTRVTFSRCLVSQGLTDEAPEPNHGYAFLCNGSYAAGNSLDIHNTVFPHHQGRLPQIAGDTRCNLVNNVAYNFDGAVNSTIYLYDGSFDGIQINSIGCITKAGTEGNLGVSYGGNAGEMIAFGEQGATPRQALYMRDNFGTERFFDTDPQWSVVDEFTSAFVSAQYQSLTPFPTTDGLPIIETTVNQDNFVELTSVIASNCGATVPVRDEVDTAMVADTINSTGSWKAGSNYPADWGTYGNKAYPTSTAGDGITDDYWTHKGLSARGALDLAPSKYLWIEEYINDLADRRYSHA